MDTMLKSEPITVFAVELKNETLLRPKWSRSSFFLFFFFFVSQLDGCWDDGLLLRIVGIYAVSFSPTASVTKK